MSGFQAKLTLEAARQLAPPLETRWRDLYGWSEGEEPNYSPPRPYSARVGRLVRDLCGRHGLCDRMPRYIAPGPLAANKRVAERLFLKTYELELEEAKTYRIWAYRKAAWTVDEWEESIADMYRSGGETKLRELPGVGKRLAAQIAAWLGEDGAK